MKYKISKDYEQKILREGWFDKLSNFFKNEQPTSNAAKKLADAWITEKEIDIGEDLSADVQKQIYQFVEIRYERALKTYEDSEDPIRKTVFIIVRLLDKRLGPIIDRYYDKQQLD